MLYFVLPHAGSSMLITGFSTTVEASNMVTTYRLIDLAAGVTATIGLNRMSSNAKSLPPGLALALRSRTIISTSLASAGEVYTYEFWCQILS